MHHTLPTAACVHLVYTHVTTDLIGSKITSAHPATLDYQPGKMPAAVGCSYRKYDGFVVKHWLGLFRTMLLPQRECQMDAQPPLTRDEIADFAAAMAAAFEDAVANGSLHRMVCNIAGVRIGLDFANPDLAAAFRPALADIEIAWSSDVDLQLCVFDSTASGVAIPAFKRPMQSLIGGRGECVARCDAQSAVVFDFGNAGPYVIDPVAGRGVVALNDLRQLPYWALAAPFRGALAMLLQPRGIQFVHGAAIGRPDGVIFLTGHGGAGKSTTALTSHRRGLTVLGDDYVALKVPEVPGLLPSVHRVFSSIKLHAHEVPDAADAPPAGQDKVVLYPFAEQRGTLCREAPCIGFWSAGFGDGKLSSLEPRHPDEVARIAVSSTGLQMPGNDTTMAALVGRCAMATPSIQQLQLGSDRDGVVDTIEAFLDGSSPDLQSSPKPIWDTPNALRPVSVIIPVYNGASFIGEALQSIASQGYPDLEIIVIDDGSTDDLDATLQQTDIAHRLIRQPNQGPAAARNAGIRAATGEWIAFLDVDDLWTQGALQQLASDLLLHSDVPVVHGKIATLHQQQTAMHWPPDHLVSHAFPYSIHAGLYRRAVFETIGGFDDSLRYGEDTEWFIRLKTTCRSITIPDIIVQWRLHDGNMTNDEAAFKAGSRAAWLKILARRLRSKRAEQVTVG